jgi:hypothetical protein
MATHSQREGQFASVNNLLALGAARTLALFTCRAWHALCLSVLANATCPSPVVPLQELHVQR